ncbi:hypothetical protein DFA_10464 [Cavenderia fasciculata]|uniref:Uncharacterized protein n=1 Tax=Cavenderia fasciculata TaxID=261658 RepID=F4QAA3_CACFS|nr:uncharacterized protein DFA_10464 [Cavenderia fasciculata]EGG15622.1 hypothetical protein DFA_10464 [Cavenderia fasciculata]|eukprot:XP_004354364.1 hypothetical protein DFA_10464 [Cavenderia fasciculata]
MGRNRKQQKKKDEDEENNEQVDEVQSSDDHQKEEQSSSKEEIEEPTPTTTVVEQVKEKEEEVPIAKEEEEEETKKETKQPTPTKKKSTTNKSKIVKEKVEEQIEEKEEEEKEEQEEEKPKLVKKKSTMTKKEEPKIEQEDEEEEKPKPKPVQSKPVVNKPAPQQQPQQQQSSGGWGGWFSSISTAVSSTISSITQVDEDEVDPEPYVPPPPKEQPKKKERKVVQDDDDETTTTSDDEGNTTQEEGDEDDVEGLLNVVDKGVFKAADMIADSFMFASSLLSTGYKKVQENANLDNVNKLANMSLESTKKATNSEIYGKGSKIATQTMDSAVERLESVGASAYSMFSSAKKNIKESIVENQNLMKEIEQQQQQVSPNGSTPSTSNNSSPSNSNSNIPPPSSSMSSSYNKRPKINIEEEQVIFKDNEFDAAKCSSHFNIPHFVQELERISVESTMKIHQFNRKTPKDIKIKVEQAFNELKDLLENESPEFSDNIPKNLTNDSESFELEKYYNQYFELLQDYLPTLANQSQPTALCRGLEKLFRFASIGMELLASVAQHSLDEKPTDEESSSMGDVEGVMKWTLSKANIYSYLIFKIIHDIKSISSILIEIIKAKQNPQTRKYLNTISMETNNLTANINDSRACFISSCSIIFIQQVKSKPFGVPPSPAK